MLHLEVLQNQWLIFALVGGAAVVFAVILLYVALWRPRDETQSPEACWRSFMPWLIILIVGAVALFAAVYTVRAVLRPPNW